MVQKASQIVFICPLLLIILLSTSDVAFPQLHNNIPHTNEKIGHYRDIIGSIKASVDPSQPGHAGQGCSDCTPSLP
ncbi:hypothetical protein L1049_008988 [Liquidambar formosana]|uniref:Transmembrane protein n=1 Tax=Liquidambar formosana TaxID=63359 RepID=A0AAP0SAJ4_LIQFO